MSLKKPIFSCIAILLFLAVSSLVLQNQGVFRDAQDEQAAPLPPAQSYSQKTPRPDPVPEKEAETLVLPETLLLPVPFTPQAPTANWDELHNEACEEASVVMANAFFQEDARSILPAVEVEKEIEQLTTWQEENLGYYLSIDAQETVQMIEEVYGLNAEVVTEFSEDTLKTALVENKLVLAPVNGQLLDNPYFHQPGPIYHMFVIKGYDATSFIVNDPGTKRGQDYRYDYQTIKNALGDYDHQKKKTDPKKPALIIISK